MFEMARSDSKQTEAPATVWSQWRGGRIKEKMLHIRTNQIDKGGTGKRIGENRVD